MTSVRFSVIIATIGRPSLRHTLQSIGLATWMDGDEVLVIGDGPRPEARHIVAGFMTRLPVSYAEHAREGSMAGAAQRNFGMWMAQGTHLLFIDDDDRYTLGALDFIRDHVKEAPDDVHVHKMRARGKRFSFTTLWQEQRVFLGNIGTPMFCVPNVPEKVGRWPMNQYCCDIAFLEDTLRRRGSGFVHWHDDVVADIY